MKKKMVCILMAGVMASLVPAQMVFAEGDSGEKTVVKFQTWNPGDEEYTHAMLRNFQRRIRTFRLIILLCRIQIM